MTTRKLRIGLWSVSVIMGALAALTIVWAVGPVAGSRGIRNLDSSNPPQSLSALTQSNFNPSELEQVCQVDLRRPLHDPLPPAPPAAPPIQPPPPLNIHLSGTIIEPGHCQALIAMPDGTVELKNLGEIAGNARIREIREGSITVEYFGQPTVLNVVEEKSN